MPTLDIFKADAFSLFELTDRYQDKPFAPGLLGSLGIFARRGIRTTRLGVEEKDGRLTLIQTSQRGAPASTVGMAQRRMRDFRIPHLALEARITADSIQDLRAFGSETELQMVQGLVDEAVEDLRVMHEVTQEFHRVGALKGLIIDADGGTIYNLFTEFGVAQQTLDIAFPTSSTDVNARIVAAKRLSEDHLGGMAIGRWLAFVGRDFWDSLVGHESVKRAYDTQQGLHLGQDLRDAGFTWGGVTFREYRGEVETPGGSSQKFVADDEGYIAPITTPPLFVTRDAPADFQEAVNTLGREFYVKLAPDERLNRFTDVHTQSNPISLCLRPRAVVKLAMS